MVVRTHRCHHRVFLQILWNFLNEILKSKKKLFTSHCHDKLSGCQDYPSGCLFFCRAVRHADSLVRLLPCLTGLFGSLYILYNSLDWCVCVWGGCTYTMCQERTLCMFYTCEVQTFDQGWTHSRSAVGFSLRFGLVFLENPGIATIKLSGVAWIRSWYRNYFLNHFIYK